MSEIRARLFGTPVVTKDGKEVIFPYNKVKALFYYISVNKKATRDELAALLWTDEKDSVAKKNLRNALYKIKKSFDEEVIISPKKSIVMLNPEFNIDVDIDVFLNDEEDFIDVYRGEFLQGFFVKNAEQFDEWLFKEKERFKILYVSKLYEKIELDLQQNNSSNIEKYTKKLINIDEFDERAYKILMEHYKENGNYRKVIECYNRLTQLLDNELGITPDKNIKKVFDDVIEKMNNAGQVKGKNNSFFYGRTKELSIIENNYNNFINGKGEKSIVLVGEAGVGKTRLKDKFMENINKQDVYVFSTNCYQVEKEYLLKPWSILISKISDIIVNDKIDIPYIWENVINSIFPEFTNRNYNTIKLLENIDTVKYQVMADALTDILKVLTEKKKVIFVFEDIQWMDSMSLSLLSSVILHENDNIMFIATYRNEYDKDIDRFLTIMNKYNKIMRINLSRFTTDDVEGFVEKALPKHNINKDMLKKIYTETEGNAFFLTEYLNIIKSNGDINIMSVKMQDILKSRFLSVSDEGKKILNIVSLFFDEASLDIIEKLTKKDELEIVDIMEELENKFIIEEVDTSNLVGYKFTHQKLREFVYMKQSDGRRRILHNKIGEILEKTLKHNKTDINTYHKLIYHYSSAQNKIKTLYYKIKSLNYYLNFSHELFPIIANTDEEAYKYAYFTKQQTVKCLKGIEVLLKEICKKDYDNEEVIRLEIAFLHMKGRYLIREGDYEQGTGLILDMIEKSILIEDRDYSLEGYKQMIYFCIQTNNKEVMIKYIELALDLAVESNYHKEIGILLRFKGLYKMMKGQYTEAEKLLNESINIFNVTKQVANKYSLNIAAAYNYIGEIRKYNMKFDEALEYYDKAIAICENKNALTSIAIFEINAGEAAFDMGNYSKAKEYFSRAYDLYTQLDMLWRRSTVEAFMSLLLCKEGEYNEALQYLKDADIHSKKIKNPHEVGIVYRVKAEIRSNMNQNSKIEKAFTKYLSENVEHYCSEGIRFLKSVMDSYEINLINKLKTISI